MSLREPLLEMMVPMGEIGIYAVMYELIGTIGRNNSCLCEKLEYMQ